MLLMRVLGVAALLAASSMPLACQAAAVRAPAASETGPTWLIAGAAWQYQVVTSDRAKPQSESTYVLSVHAEAQAQLADGQQLHQLCLEHGDGGKKTFAVWSTSPQAVLQHATTSVRQRGSLVENALPMVIWRAPDSGAAKQPSDAVAGGHSWQWVGPCATPLAELEAATAWDHVAESLGMETVVVPAGRYLAEHCRMRSQRAGAAMQLRDIWLTSDVGIVQEVTTCGTNKHSRKLLSFTAGHGPDTQRLLRFLDEEQRNPKTEPFNNTPRITWLEAGPEALLVAGRIAAVHTDNWRRCYFVARERILPFVPGDLSWFAPVAHTAFETKTARPAEHVSLHGLALLLARAAAALEQFGNVAEEPVTLEPTRKLPTKGRQASAQIVGGALDGATRHIAVWLTIDRTCDLHVATDLPVVAVEGR